MKYPSYILWLLPMYFFLGACQSTPRAEAPSGFSLSDTMWSMTRISPVEMHPRQEQFRFFGKVTAAQGKTVPVYSMTGGKVGRLHVDQGDYVRRGQILAEIQSSQVAELERRRLELQNALLESRNKLDMVKDMHAHHLASDRDLLSAQHEVDNAQAALRQMEEVFRLYNQARDGQYQVISPIGGYVLEMNIAEGMPLPDDYMDPVFVVAELDPVWVLTQVSEADLAHMREGLEARIWTASHPDREFVGRIDRIYQIIDASTRTATLRIPLENKDLDLKPNMSVRVTVVKEGADSLATIPREALLFDRNRHWVVVYRSREDMEIREVHPVSESDSHVQVSGELHATEKVISGHPLLVYEALMVQQSLLASDQNASL